MNDMFSTNGSELLILKAVDIYRFIIRGTIVSFVNKIGLLADNPLCIISCKRSERFGILTTTLLSGNDFFYAMCEIVSCIFGHIKTHTQVQNSALARSLFRTNGVHEFIGTIRFTGLSIFVLYFSDKHEKGVVKIV